MSDGLITPGQYDGMGVVVQRRSGVGNEIVLVRNHEASTSANAANVVGALSTNVAKYDTGTTGGNYQIGGTTNLVWRDGEWVGSYASLGGIYRPSRAAPAPGGSWLSNEELRSNAVRSTGRMHGYTSKCRPIPASTRRARCRSSTWAASRTKRARSTPTPATGT
jgi:hypothetical protein